MGNTSIILGYLGPSGSFSDAVRKHLHPENKYSDWVFKPYPRLSNVLDALENTEISLALLPIENSKSGLLINSEGQEFFARLASSDSDLYIVAEKFGY